MIVTLGYRGVFRQAQYETVTIEGSITVDDTVDELAPAEIPQFLHHELDKLIAPQISRACTASRYDSDETVAYEWEGIVNAPHSTAQDSTQQRRVRRRQT